MVGKKENLVRIVAMLVAVAVIAAIIVAVLMDVGAPGDGSDDEEVGNQIDSLVMMGEGGWESFIAVAVGNDGSVYAVGIAYDQTNISTEGAFDGTYGGDSELILVKYAPGLESLLVCTNLGGGSDERSYDIAVGIDGFVYVAGGTTSTNFPAEGIGNADPDFADGFILKISIG